MALVAGARRGGKSFATYMCQIAALLDVPMAPNRSPTIGWTISRTYRERDELDQLIHAKIPASYYKHQKAPEHRFTFAHGSYLRNMSADDPDALKQGRVDYLLYNEPQKMHARAIVHGLYGTADQAGLVLLAANKPSVNDSRGEWLFDLREAIEDERREQARDLNREPFGALYFNVPAGLNTRIDQPARQRVAKIAVVIDKEQAQADEDEGGPWQKPGDRASRDFDKHKHVAAVPELAGGRWRECTAEVASDRGTWGDWKAIGGVDFQDKSWAIAGVVARLFGDPRKPTIWFCDEHHDRTDERQYLEGFEERFAARRGYTKDSLLWIGDASGSWQTAKHESGDRTSFSIWQDESWTIIPPQDSKSDQEGVRARNPFVDDQLALWNELLREDRLKFDPRRCEWLIECVREAVTKRTRGRRHIVQNKHAHALAAALYLAWRIAGKVDGKPATPDDVRIIRRRR